MSGNSALLFALACGLVAVIYGFWARSSILSLSAGNARMSFSLRSLTSPDLLAQAVQHHGDAFGLAVFDREVRLPRRGTQREPWRRRNRPGRFRIGVGLVGAGEGFERVRAGRCGLAASKPKQARSHRKNPNNSHTHRGTPEKPDLTAVVVKISLARKGSGNRSAND